MLGQGGGAYEQGVLFHLPMSHSSFLSLHTLYSLPWREWKVIVHFLDKLFGIFVEMGMVYQ